jgi:transposase
MNAHSNDLRQRILNYALTHSIRETARIFQVSPDTVHRLKKLYFGTGSVAPLPPKVVRARAVSPEGELFIKILLLEDVDLTLEELCARYENTYGVRVAVTTMHNTLQRMNISLKKKPSTTPRGTPNNQSTKKSAISIN